MTIHAKPMARRLFLGTSLAVLLLACGAEEPAPTQVNMTVTAAAGANTTAAGEDRPVTVTIVQLSSAAAFNAADYFALQSPDTALGAEMLAMQSLAVPTPGTQVLSFPPMDTASMVGVIVGFRDPAGKTYKATAPIVPATVNTIGVNITAGGVTLSSQ